MSISKVSNIRINKQKVYSKNSFGCNADKNSEFLKIIASFPNVNENNPSIQDELEYDKCYKTVKEYLENNCFQSSNLGNGLIKLASLGHYKIVELLLGKYKVNANNKDIIGSTPIMYAAMKGHTKTIEVLGRYGADINKKNNMGYNAIMLAAMENHAEALDKIIAINPVYIDDTDPAGRTALIIAVIMENKEAAQKLIDYNANLNIKSNAGKTALMYAADNLDRDLMLKLIKSGADPKIVDNFGCTAKDIYEFTTGMLCLKIAEGKTNSIPQELLIRYYEIINAKIK